MLGSIIGDICGSTYEFTACKDINVHLTPPDSEFTDDSVLSIATAEVILTGGDYAEAYHRYGHQYPSPMGNYGPGFLDWLQSRDPKPYNSWGNGSAMRAGPIGFACDTLDAVLAEAERSAAVTHSHPEGIKGAQATAAAIFLARSGASKTAIRDTLESTFGYHLQRTCNDIRPTYGYDVTCQGTVPQAILAFLDSIDFEHALRLAISLGGDADTLACITGGIAEAFYRDLPNHLVAFAEQRLPPELLFIIRQFNQRYPM